jgi:protein TonB
MFEVLVAHDLRWRLQHRGAPPPAPPEGSGEPVPFRQRDRRLFGGLTGEQANPGVAGPGEAIPFRQQDRRLFGTLTRERAVSGPAAPHPAIPFWQRDRRLFEALVGRAAEPSFPAAVAAVAVRQRDRVLFETMVVQQAGRRVAMRGAWTAAAAAFQAAFVTSLVLLTAFLAARERPAPPVEVQLVRTVYRRPAPPPPAALPMAARRAPAGPRLAGATVKARPPAVLIQPREIAETMKAPDPAEPIEEYDLEYAEGAEGGVVGGVPGYVPEGTGDGDGGDAGGIMEAPRYVSSGFRAPAEVRPGCVGSSVRLPHDLAGFAAGQVVVKFAVGRDGSVGLARLMTPVPDSRIFEAIRQALASCRWRPGSDAQGQPVTLWVVLPLRFAAE